jgi:RNA polymerase sigma-70 factor (ECF subfamily)
MDAQQLQPKGASATLGDVLYADPTIPTESEQAWVAMLQSIATRDPTALHDLYERTHRLVYTLILRITGRVETAEELTLQVFYDIWTNATPYDAAEGTVLAWIMNQARYRAMERMDKEKRDAPEQILPFAEQGRLVSEALQTLTPQERTAIESAYFSDLPQAYVAAQLNPESGSFRSWIRSGVMKLRRALARNT